MSFFTPLSGNATVTSSSSLRTWLETTTPVPSDGWRTWSPGRNFVSPAAALLLEACLVVERARVREHAVLHAREEHDRELEALHGVERDERRDRLRIGELVLVRYERDLLEERRQLLL